MARYRELFEMLKMAVTIDDDLHHSSDIQENTECISVRSWVHRHPQIGTNLLATPHKPVVIFIWYFSKHMELGTNYVNQE